MANRVDSSNSLLDLNIVENEPRVEPTRPASRVHRAIEAIRNVGHTFTRRRRVAPTPPRMFSSLDEFMRANANATPLQRRIQRISQDRLVVHSPIFDGEPLTEEYSSLQGRHASYASVADLARPNTTSPSSLAEELETSTDEEPPYLVPRTMHHYEYDDAGLGASPASLAEDINTAVLEEPPYLVPRAIHHYEYDDAGLGASPASLAEEANTTVLEEPPYLVPKAVHHYEYDDAGLGRPSLTSPDQDGYTYVVEEQNDGYTYIADEPIYESIE